jgi:hypothetical protein
MRSMTVLVIAAGLASAPASAAEPPALAKARALYNAADYDGAIAAVVQARTQSDAADAAALVDARAHIERYRQKADPADLTAAREALNAIHPTALMPRDQLDFLVGLGQSLYLSELFGPAAELFDTALERGAFLPARDRMMLLDWWATALDREAQASAPDRRARLYEQMATRMGEELRRIPAVHPPTTGGRSPHAASVMSTGRGTRRLRRGCARRLVQRRPRRCGPTSTTW